MADDEADTAEIDTDEPENSGTCPDCDDEMDTDCNGNARCPTCDGPCPCCDSGPGPGEDDTAKMPVEAGYVFGFKGDGPWEDGANDDWETEVYQATGDEEEEGEAFIDGTRCIVFSCPDGVYRAVNEVNVR